MKYSRSTSGSIWDVMYLLDSMVVCGWCAKLTGEPGWRGGTQGWRNDDATKKIDLKNLFNWEGSTVMSTRTLAAF